MTKSKKQHPWAPMGERANFTNSPSLFCIQHPRKGREVPEKLRPLDLIRYQVKHLQPHGLGRSRIIRHGGKFPHPLHGSYTIFIKSNIRRALLISAAKAATRSTRRCRQMAIPPPTQDFWQGQKPTISPRKPAPHDSSDAEKNTAPHFPNVGK